MEDILCACGAVMKKIGSQKAALTEEPSLSKNIPEVTVDIYECDDCGTISFFKTSHGE